jgi:pimeloyl-ACP methyl ester carboxylesterase
MDKMEPLFEGGCIDGDSVNTESNAMRTKVVIGMLFLASVCTGAQEALMLSWPNETIDLWNGYKRHNFTVEGCKAWVVEPKTPRAGKPWSWCMEFPDAFVERCAAPELLAKGFHHAHIVVGNTFGSPAAVKHFNVFYDAVRSRGLAPKVVLIGISRGGLYCYRWAAENPGKVAVIYGDAPVCDFKSWPGGKGKGDGSKGDWAALIDCYQFKDEADALKYPGNPIDTLEPLAKAGVAIIHVVGDSDTVVPVAENTAIVETRYKELGGEISVIHKPGIGHHPHGLQDPSPVVDFILSHTVKPSVGSEGMLPSDKGEANRLTTTDHPASAAEDVQSGSGTVVIRPIADDTMLLNPGKGYVQYYGADDRYTKDYISIGYTRCSWARLEPEEGHFDWRDIDGFIDQFKTRGKKIAFGVMSISTGYGSEYVTPKWVFDAGAIPFVIPDDSSPTKTQVIAKKWDDPVFVEKLGHFVQALGKRYDGHPDIAFFDIRSYGNWGEGHVGYLNGLELATPEVYQQYYLQPYMTAFKKTRLIMTWGHDLYNPIYDWACAQGVGIRRDGILSEYSKDGSECFRALGRAPAVFEYCDGYEDTKKKGYWSTDLLIKYIQAGKPSYMQWVPKMFEENRQFCLKLGNKIGYHFILQQATVPTRFRPEAPFSIQWQWLNDGVAPLYEPCHVAVALLDHKDQVVQRQWLPDSNPRNWIPGECTTESFSVVFSSSPPGNYKLAVGLFLDRQEAVPTYRLGIQGRTAQGWYVLSDKIEQQEK